MVPIVPDDKNWTWVLDQVCPDCGFDASAVAGEQVPAVLRSNIQAWPGLLARPHVTLRPTHDQWSAAEYGCHVRDVYRLFDHRLQRMLAEDGPHFENWDQDVTAIEQRYDLQDPSVVTDELVQAGHVIADRFATVTGDQWDRTGFRSDGAVFTVLTFARYFLHDPIHHLDDVERGYQVLADGSLD
jgi:hypothetical protein